MQLKPPALDRSTSLYLDLIRPLAALLVMLSHVSFNAISGGRLVLFAPYGGQAVDVFFVLSGFVIAYVVSTIETDWPTYAISRITRIYSVALPAILLTVILDHFGSRHRPAVYADADQGFGAGAIVRSLTFLGEMWNAHRFPGCNSPYWSLGFEVWYYVAFGAWNFVSRRWRWPAIVAVLVFIGPKVAVMFPVWLMGVGAYHYTVRHRLPARTGWVLLLAPLALLAGYECLPHAEPQPFMPLTLAPGRLLAIGQDYLLGGLFSLHLIGFVTVADRFAGSLAKHAKTIRWAAGGTFSLYLVHMPVMRFLAAYLPWPNTSLYTLAALLTLTPAGCFCFAELSERRKKIWRRFISLIMSPLVKLSPAKAAA